VSFNAAEAHRVAHDRPTVLPAPTGGMLERVAEGTYGLLFAPQDRALRRFYARRLSRLLLEFRREWLVQRALSARRAA
jgi:hypothetical protein